jgi:uncharacterized MAPEG superfamily protein
MSATAMALAGFAGWFVLLSLILVTYRSALVLGGRKAANAFRVDGSDVGGFGQRLTRARDNVYENLPAFAGLVLAASMAGRLDVTNPLAETVLLARIAQSLTHILSVSVPAVFIRVTFYLVQLGIWAWWAVRLLG